MSHPQHDAKKLFTFLCAKTDFFGGAHMQYTLPMQFFLAHVKCYDM